MLRRATRLIGAIIATLLLGACSAPARQSEPPAAQVLFVCEHGNVKSLMAASYFNQLARERGLPFRGIARGVAPDSTSVPDAIVEGLRRDGFDVNEFHPAPVGASDLSSSQRVITIGTPLPAIAQPGGLVLERWDDVPPASVDYGSARDALKSHVDKLVEQLAHP